MCSLLCAWTPSVPFGLNCLSTPMSDRQSLGVTVSCAEIFAIIERKIPHMTNSIIFAYVKIVGFLYGSTSFGCHKQAGGEGREGRGGGGLLCPDGRFKIDL